LKNIINIVDIKISDVLIQITKLNLEPKIHGIIVQMPLDSVNRINSHLITDAVCPNKDVDG
jgi:methylenetetrahydrofolate dehydrogenase (NADP+) / methenyltetrahydrofolate cyclohydrolase / formyltetrahydrofolate synthetase